MVKILQECYKSINHSIIKLLLLRFLERTRLCRIYLMPFSLSHSRQLRQPLCELSAAPLRTRSPEADHQVLPGKVVKRDDVVDDKSLGRIGDFGENRLVGSRICVAKDDARVESKVRLGELDGRPY